MHQFTAYLSVLLLVLALVSVDQVAAKRKVLWGALIGDQFTGRQAPADWNAVKKFEKKCAGGKKVTALHHGGDWYNSGGCGGYCRFDATGLGNIVRNKALPVYAWGSKSNANAASFLNSAIASGSQDAYIRQWAQDAKAFGHKLVVCPNWEMNGDWYPWSPSKKNGGATGTAADFINAWRRIFKIVRKEVGAKNVLFGWVPNVDPDGWWAGKSGYSLKELFPGKAYVDMVGLDGYNGADPAWKSFKDLFGPTYRELLKIAKRKPVILLEVGCTESRGNKAKWISDMFRDLPKSFSKVNMLLWYNRRDIGPGDHTDWVIESSKKSRKAFTAGIKKGNY